MEASKVRKYIERLDRLSTIPVIIKRIIEITGNPSSPPEELYYIISHDQSLAERVLRLANSSFFRHSRGVTSIKQAIMLLGYEKIRSIALGMSVLGIFSKKGDLNLRNFWSHCYEVAIISAMVAEKATMMNASNIFLAGLLHDLGRLVFYSLQREQYISILGTDDLLEKEVSIFGCDHASAGGWLAEKSQLPDELVIAIKYHHAPGKAPEYRDIVSVVSISEALSRRFITKIEDDGIWTKEHDSILLEYSLNNDDIMEIEAKLMEEGMEINKFLELLE